MSETPPPLPDSSAPSLGRIAFGVALMASWAAVHVGLFYLAFVSGVVIDILLGTAKSVMFPGRTHFSSAGVHEMFGWAGLLVVGLCSAGAAGVPGGLALMRSSGRKRLWGWFWLLLIAGGLCELGALFLLVRNAFSLPE